MILIVRQLLGLRGLVCVWLLLGHLQIGTAFGQTRSGQNPPPQQSKPAPTVASTQNGTVSYSDLKNHKVSLPYGQPFLVTGDTADVQLAGGPLKNLLATQTVSGDYTDSDGTNGTIPVAAITGTAWNATIGKLAADTSVTIDFQFTGLLDSSLQQTVVSEMFGDPAYRAAVSQFVKAAQGKASAAQMAAATLLAQAATEVLTSVLARKGLTPKNPADLKTSLSAVLTANMEPIFNLGEEFADLQNSAFHYADLVGLPPKDFSALSVQQLYNKLVDKAKPPDYSKLPAGFDAPTRENVKAAVDTFVETYPNAMFGLEASLRLAVFTGSSSLAVGNDQQSDVVSDLKKYAGFDVGALYAYRLSELRTFAMVHIYFGTVQLKTDAPPLKPGAGERLRQRLSLAFGMALKDISGASNSKVSSQNAFVYGIGVRLNKYFRISVGGMLYRTTLPAVGGVTGAANGTLRHELFIGPSIDVTALSALQSIFAKAKSN